MKTVWGEALDIENVLPEYPRPQLARESFLSLNGVWRYAMTKCSSEPGEYDGDIVVPFSPEAELSGVSRSLSPGEYLWYRRAFALPEGFSRGRVILNFGAVDQIAEVFVNGCEAGCHTGGYLPFSLDITGLLREGDNILTLRVQDTTDTSYLSRGKQKTKRGGIFYTPQSGIWQSVWLESVPEKYIHSLRIRPLYDESAVELTVCADTFVTADIPGYGSHTFPPDIPHVIPLPGFTPWSPEQPFLYGLTLTSGEDRVTSYFGMRKVEVKRAENGIARIYLNNEEYFMNGLLDQGYWSDGLYTAPSDEALVFDITEAKRLGFNTLRKHIKIESGRFYYHCDRLGMLVWQDMVNGGGKYASPFLNGVLPFLGIRLRDDRGYSRFGREDAEGRRMFVREAMATVDVLYNHPSIVVWVPFNEAWGQFDSLEITRKLCAIDSTRLIDHASGWYDQGGGDFCSLHIYFKKLYVKRDARAFVISEYGGYNCAVPGHMYSEVNFGYKAYPDRKALVNAYRSLMEEQVEPLKERGLCAAIYTQLSDVEEELNGMLTYDRRVNKLG